MVQWGEDQSWGSNDPKAYLDHTDKSFRSEEKN